MTIKPDELTTQGQEEIQQPIAEPNDLGESTQQPDPAPPPAETAAKDDQEKKPDGKFVELHTSDFRKIKETAKEKGRKAALNGLAERAKELGFSSVDDMMEFAAQAKAAPSPEPEPEPQIEEEEEMTADKSKAKAKTQGRKATRKESDDPRQRRIDRRLAKAEKASQDATRKWKQEERRRRDLQKQLDAKDAEIDLRDAAIRAGVQDVDYAITILRRSLKKKTEEELASFDETEFFTGLRDSKPYLFNETVAPATTGNGTSDKPPPPDAGNVQQQATGEKQFDARSAKKEDVDKRLSELGLSPHASYV